MSWGRIDDKLHAHPKPESAGLEAMGLWVLALSYSSDVLTDGFISTERAARLAGDLKSSKRLALKLIGVGLWHLANDPCPSGHDDCDRYRRDEAGFRFHDWDLYQPTRGEVLAEKDRKKKNLEAYRERRRLPRNRNETGCTTGITTGSATDSEAGCDATKKPGGNHGPLPLPSPEEISTGKAGHGTRISPARRPLIVVDARAAANVAELCNLTRPESNHFVLNRTCWRVMSAPACPNCESGMLLINRQTSASFCDERVLRQT